MSATAFRRPSADEQQVLRELVVRPIRPDERARFDQLLIAHHYLKSATLVGEHLRYLATHRGRWLALLAWAAPARHLRARDSWIGWSCYELFSHRTFPRSAVVRGLRFWPG